MRKAVNADKNKKSININTTALAVLVVFSFALGILIGRGSTLVGVDMQRSGESDAYQLRDGGFKFIRPLSQRESTAEGHRIRELKPFRYKIAALVKGKLAAGEAESISVYFRDLNNGHWFGINENETFSLETLLKIPVMFAYFKRAETQPLLLKKRLTYTGTEDWSREQNIKPLLVVKPGDSYTVDDLIYRMIASGDNNAFQVLLTNIPPGSLKKIFADLYVDYDPGKDDESLSLRGYASFFRVLYNASYLNKEFSEKALDYLSKGVFKDGMIASLPPGLALAGKYGERTVRITDDKGDRTVYQMHEFGIVYYPNHPYLLGVMTRGTDFQKLEKVIRDVARQVYDDVYEQTM